MILTARLVLRRWRSDDRAPFAVLNSDPEVMRFMPGPLSVVESDRWVDGIDQEFDRDGFGLWALEAPGEASFVGFTGLRRVPFATSFTPAVEIGWRLSRQAWGRGYATEAARAALCAGFERFHLPEIVAETAETNMRSRRVMDRLQMRLHPEESFANPAYAPEHPCSRHLLYRVTREQWST